MKNSNETEKRETFRVIENPENRFSLVDSLEMARNSRGELSSTLMKLLAYAYKCEEDDDCGISGDELTSLANVFGDLLETVDGIRIDQHETIDINSLK